MTRWTSAITLTLALSAITMSCGGSDDGDPNDGDSVATYSVTGEVVDFETGDPLTGSATVSTDGLTPPPAVSVTGADFTIEGIPPFSVFHLLAGSPPNYRSTYNVATEVTDSNLNGVTIQVVSEDYLASLASAFGVIVSPGTSVLLAQLIDDAGDPVAGVPGDAFELDVGIAGPFFLDADRAPAPAASESSASGYVVLFDVPTGLVRVNAVAGSGYTMAMPDSPSAATAATLAGIVVNSGEAPEIPQNVSFADDIAPLFLRRGCVLCHDGGGIGKDLGGLHLNGADEKMYKELATEVSAIHGILRVDTENPDESLMLTLPSREDPPDAHPNVTFASKDDPDYQLIRAWIAEGALQN